MNPEGRPYPPTAQIAMQQGVCTAQNVVSTIRNKPLKKFEFSNKGTVASLGKGEGIAVVGNKLLKGWSAAQLKKVVDMRYLLTIGGIPLMLKKGRFL
jgi:NADH dehydrogenase